MQDVKKIINETEQMLKGKNFLTVSEMQKVFKTTHRGADGTVDLFHFFCDAFFLGYGLGMKQEKGASRYGNKKK